MSVAAAAARIPEELKMGREYALLGNYDTALVYFEGGFVRAEENSARL